MKVLKRCNLEPFRPGKVRSRNVSADV